MITNVVYNKKTGAIKTKKEWEKKKNADISFEGICDKYAGTDIGVRQDFSASVSEQKIRIGTFSCGCRAITNEDQTKGIIISYCGSDEEQISTFGEDRKDGKYTEKHFEEDEDQMKSMMDLFWKFIPLIEKGKALEQLKSILLK